MHHEGDVVDVDATCGDVGGHEHLDLAASEGLHVLLSCLLREIALEVDGGDPRLGEAAGQLLGLVLGADEEHRSPLACSELVDDLGLVSGAHRQDMVLHIRLRGRVAVNRVGDRI